MASSVSGQDEPNRALWLTTRAGKMEPSCPLGPTRYIPQAKFHQKPYNKSFIDQVCSIKMAGYWPRSFFCEFITRINSQKENLANFQPSWPHTWSITHTYWLSKFLMNLKRRPCFHANETFVFWLPFSDLPSLCIPSLNYREAKSRSQENQIFSKSRRHLKNKQKKDQRRS